MSSTPDRGTILRRIYATAQIFMAALLVAFIAGSLLFTGGRVASQQNANWPEAWGWPVFPVPAWLLIVPALIGVIVVVPMSMRTPAARTPLLLGAVGQTVAAGGSAIVFSFLFPAETGLIPMPGDSDLFLGWHWIAAALSLASILVLIVAVAAKGREYERLRTSGADLS